MNKSQICIVIPIYKDTLNEFEVISVERCIHVLSDYQIHFIHPKGLKLDFYKSKFSEVQNYKGFDSKYFRDLYSYNLLMLNENLYKSFQQFEYMLIYQTDCYVFKDDLKLWADKEYDYIGGIWFENYRDDPNTSAKMWFPGNGGLSLRKTSSFYKLLTSKKSLGFKKLDKDKELLKKDNKFNFFKWNLLLPFRLLGYKNNFNYLSKIYKFNEDVFFMEASVKYKKLTSPSVEEAISFSWDRHPEYLYKLHGELPFGCHAWYRDELPYEKNKEFWISKISI
jgi:hypothetical protein